MSESLAPERVQWIARVLGVQIDGGGESRPTLDFKSEWEQSFAAFQDAIETVDNQMAALGAACRQTRDPWLGSIADLGLPAVTGNFKTPLMAACLDVSRASDGNTAVPAAKARKAVADFVGHIESNPQVAACDGNPFGVSVSIRGSLLPALKSLDDVLGRAS
jgi:hypothetical protein